MRAGKTILRRAGLACLAALWAAAPAAAYDRSVLAEHNDTYKNGGFEEALAGYLEMTAREPENPTGFYNAGNAYFKLGRPGQAILYYAKAWRLDPRDPDIRANLEFALKQSGQSFVPEGVPRVLHYVYYFASDDELKAAAVCAWWAFFLLLSFHFMRPGVMNGGRAPLYVLGALFAAALLWFMARSASPFRGGAVITGASAQLMSGPGEKFTAAAALPEARLVKILDDTDDNYYEVAIPREGVKGWVKKTSAGRI